VNLISWNIQWCRGMDGRVDPARIARVARALADPDVCCFQEVAVNFPSLEGSSGEDQAALLQAGFPGYSAHFAWAVDFPDGSGGRRRFGNMILSRLPVQRVMRHSLPWPPDPGAPSMPRIALQAAVETSWGLVSVATTHLEYYSVRQRGAQVDRLKELLAEARAHPAAPGKEQFKAGPFEPLARPASSILTGDFNMLPDDPLIARLLESYADAWRIAHPGKPHASSMFVHDRSPGVAPICCDFVFVTEDLAPRIAAVRVDAETQAADHQPVIVEFRP
jgi:endonuclease/exonuclease/phosphatase family metal-dependent hydrolase